MPVLTTLIFLLHFSIQSMPDSSTIVLDWDLLKDVRQLHYEDRDSVKINSTVIKADGKLIELTGFMLPPNTKNENKNYELTEESHLSCLHTDDNQIIKVHIEFRKKETLSFTPITIRGKFKIVRFADNTIRYEITEAVVL